MPKLSICIPAYNGGPYLKKLMDELLRSPRDDIEIVVSDDCSADQTWPYLQSVAAQDVRVFISRNQQNLGMDRNFTAAVALATGQYVWLCGQDDFIFSAGIDSVLNYLEQQPLTDFIYMRSRKLIEGNGEYPKTPIVGTQHITGVGLQDYLRYSNNILPTFLPEFIIRKSLWDSVRLEPYFGTCYCQVGVFLEVSRNLNWCFLDGYYVVGLVPRGGWHNNPSAFAKITFGAYLVFARARRRFDWLDSALVYRQYVLHWRQLIKALLLVRGKKISIDPALMDELKDALEIVPLLRLVTVFLLSVPITVCMGLLAMINAIRTLRLR